jgi:alginate O-acetyltransferase complex protein AlgI
MLFNSLDFLFIFLPVSVIGFFVLARLGWKMTAAAWLGVASLVFYAWDDPQRLLPIILCSIIFNYIIGRILSQTGSRTLLVVGIAGNLLFLGYYKYINFAIHIFAHLFVTQDHSINVTLPIGISFFTFTQIAFLVDAYRHDAHEYKPIHYLLFVTFFPHLIAGPILYHKEIMPQFDRNETYVFNLPTFTLGLSYFSAGLFKKVIFADNLSIFVAPVFLAATNGTHIGFADAWLATLSFALQIYFDFSGYSDMAIGLSFLMGIKLPLNFNSPYKAASLIDFWRCWHMTLSRFLRNYLYFPLGGNRKGKFLRYVNLIITMLLGGLWHGASLNFVVWGGIHGICLAANHLFRDLLAKRGLRIPTSLGRLVTLLVVVLAWVPFRAATLGGTLCIWKSMVDFRGLQPLMTTLTDTMVIPWVVITACIALFLPNTQQLFLAEESGGKLIPQWLQWRPHWGWALIMGGALGCAIAMIMTGSVSEFLYFKF